MRRSGYGPFDICFFIIETEPVNKFVDDADFSVICCPFNIIQVSTCCISNLMLFIAHEMQRLFLNVKFGFDRCRGGGDGWLIGDGNDIVCNCGFQLLEQSVCQRKNGQIQRILCADFRICRKIKPDCESEQFE